MAGHKQACYLKEKERRGPEHLTDRWQFEDGMLLFYLSGPQNNEQDELQSDKKLNYKF